MKYTYSISLETPAKKNSRITLKNGVTIPSKNYQKWHSAALIQLYTQKRPGTPINSELEIHIKFIHGDLRRRDSDNGTSSIMDLLTDAKIIEDDNWKIIKKISVENEYIKNNSQCLIKITPFDYSIKG